MAEKYVNVVQDKYEDTKTVARCAVGATDSRWDWITSGIGS